MKGLGGGGRGKKNIKKEEFEITCDIVCRGEFLNAILKAWEDLM